MSTSVSSSKSGVIQSLSSNPGADEGTISRADYNTFAGGGGGGGGLTHRIGSIPFGSFAGTPKKATVVFTTPMADDQYAIALAEMDARTVTYESKTALGFVINLNANTVPTGSVDYVAFPYGEA